MGSIAARPKKKKYLQIYPCKKNPLAWLGGSFDPFTQAFSHAFVVIRAGRRPAPARLGAFSVRLAQSVGVLWRCSVFCGDTPSLSPSYPPCVQFCADTVGSNRASKAPHAPHQHKPTQSVAIGRSICTKPSPHPPKHPPNPPRHPISTHIEPV